MNSLSEQLQQTMAYFKLVASADPVLFRPQPRRTHVFLMSPQSP